MLCGINGTFRSRHIKQNEVTFRKWYFFCVYFCSFVDAIVSIVWLILSVLLLFLLVIKTKKKTNKNDNNNNNNNNNSKPTTHASKVWTLCNGKSTSPTLT